MKFFVVKNVRKDITILTDNDGADLPRVDPRMRTKFDDDVAAGWTSELMGRVNVKVNISTLTL